MQSRKHLIKHTRTEQRQKQKRALIRRISILGVLCLVLVGGLAWASGISQVTISAVRIDGTMLADAGAIKTNVEHDIDGRYGYLFSKRNIALFPRSAIIADVLGSFHRIEKVTLGHDTGNVLVVTVVERKPSLVWCPGDATSSVAPVSSPATAPTQSAPVDTNTQSAGVSGAQCYFTDRDGIIYAPSPSFSAPVFFTWYGPLLDTAHIPEGNRFFTSEEFIGMSRIIEGMKTENLQPVSGTIGKEDIRVKTTSVGDIVFKRNQHPEEVVNNLTAAHKALPTGVKFEYVDLRFGTKIFYKEKEVEHVANVSG